MKLFITEASRMLEISHDNLSKGAQVLSASLSFVGSLTLAVMVARPKTGGLKTPYRRIVFGLSISDVLQSFALITGPFSVPTETPNSWGVGNKASCQANGFILDVGGTAVIMYTLFLCVYYLCKLKHRMTSEKFKLTVERKSHALIIVSNLIIAGLAVEMDAFHATSVIPSYCYFAATPTGCRFSPEVYGECDATILRRVNIFIAAMSICFPLLCLLGIIIVMGALFSHAFVLNRDIEKQVPSTNHSRLRLRSSNANTTHDNANETSLEQLHNLSRLYRNEIMIQASLYVGAFCFVYILPVMGYLTSTFNGYNQFSPFLKVTGLVLYPLGGLLNILVYTRPMVASLRRTYPECSRVRAFWLVLKAGGEVPDQIDSTSCTSCKCLYYKLMKKFARRNVMSRTGRVSELDFEVGSHLTPPPCLSHMISSRDIVPAQISDGESVRGNPFRRGRYRYYDVRSAPSSSNGVQPASAFARKMRRNFPKAPLIHIPSVSSAVDVNDVQSSSRILSCPNIDALSSLVVDSSAMSCVEENDVECNLSGGDGDGGNEMPRSSGLSMKQNSSPRDHSSSPGPSCGTLSQARHASNEDNISGE